jgi:hypothetical protein
MSKIERRCLLQSVVMPGLDPGIHSVALRTSSSVTEWIAGSSPAMTTTMGVPGRMCGVGHAA